MNLMNLPENTKMFLILWMRDFCLASIYILSWQRQESMYMHKTHSSSQFFSYPENIAQPLWSRISQSQCNLLGQTSREKWGWHPREPPPGPQGLPIQRVLSDGRTRQAKSRRAETITPGSGTAMISLPWNVPVPRNPVPLPL